MQRHILKSHVRTLKTIVRIIFCPCFIWIRSLCADDPLRLIRASADKSQRFSFGALLIVQCKRAFTKINGRRTAKRNAGNSCDQFCICRNRRIICQHGGRKNLLLLHGGSSAFWPYAWFRELVGIRWVRGNDPDGFVASFHPHEPYKVVRAKCRHRLVNKLVEMDLPKDEIYTGLEQTRPVWTLMNTTISTGTFPQCTESATPWGGRVINFLPGHDKSVTRHPDFIANVKLLIDDLR